MVYSVVDTFRTPLNANCLLRCSNLLISGLYKLDEGSRIGGIQVFSVDSSTPLLKPVGHLTTAGVFDLCFPNQNSVGISIAAALSNGTVELFQLTLDESACCTISPVESLSLPHTVDGSSPIVTCVCATPNGLIVGDNVGRLFDVKVSDGRMEVDRSWDGHTFFNTPAEVWTVKHSSFTDHLMYSGGDDSLLKGWDLRDHQKPCLKMTEHSAGVTDVSECPMQTNSVLTGSYDNTVKLWDRRNWSASLQTVDVGGGAWQFVWHSDNLQVLVACMYNGWCILELMEGKLEIRSQSPTFGESLNYGVEWCGSGSELVATSTFYDATVRLWSVQ